MKLSFYFLVLTFVFVSCEKDKAVEKTIMPELMEIPNGFPAVEAPEDNSFTKERWSLGKRLFFEKKFSKDGSISCASCHEPRISFSDKEAFSKGVGGKIGTRNAPSLANVGYHPYLTREGGVPTLEMHVLVPIQEHNEFDFNIVLIAELLSDDSTYISMAKQAYDRSVDAFVITRALACFQRSLISGRSRYDQYVNYNELEVLSSDEIKGMNLFFSERTHCADCHSDFNFTNYNFLNNGLYEEYSDPGRFRVTNIEKDRALFKVPSLRNIELTGPYMHDGSLQTLDEVVAHYNRGGFDHPHKSELIKPLQLSESEQKELVLFLRTLTDESFVSNPLFQN